MTQTDTDNGQLAAQGKLIRFCQQIGTDVDALFLQPFRSTDTERRTVHQCLDTAATDLIERCERLDPQMPVEGCLIDDLANEMGGIPLC